MSLGIFPKLESLDKRKGDVSYGGGGERLKSKIIGLLTLEITGHPEGEIRGNMYLSLKESC